MRIKVIFCALPAERIWQGKERREAFPLHVILDTQRGRAVDRSKMTPEWTEKGPGQAVQAGVGGHSL